VDRAHSIDVTIPPNAPSILSDFGAKYGISSGLMRPVFHNGIDIVTPPGYPIIAPADGVVAAVVNRTDYGLVVTIVHEEKTRSLVTGYYHLDQALVKADDEVIRGQKIGTVGTSGSTAGDVPHLHFLASDGLSKNPHHFWIGGVGKIVCFDPKATYMPEERAILTYPVECPK
jgi:murein DD-endopeptidase MepM/ murein hydrolase activator NlpD